MKVNLAFKAIVAEPLFFSQQCHRYMHFCSANPRLIICRSLLSKPNRRLSHLQIMARLIAIEGNIGSGKTTVLDYLQSKYGDRAKFFSEPVKKWQSCHGENLLKMLYEDPKRWSFMFQQYVMLTLYKNLEEASKEGKPIVMERSLQSARNVFAESLKNRKMITAAEFSVLDDWFHFLTKPERKNAPATVIYIRSDPKLCLTRIKERGRPEEAKVDMTLLSSLHELHERWLIPKCKHCSNHMGAHLNVVIIENTGDRQALMAEIQRKENSFNIG